LGSGIAYGSDHNPKAMTIWLAGGGCRAGHTIGATDERGAEAVAAVRHIRDFRGTLLRLLGFDDNWFTFSTLVISSSSVSLVARSSRS
jgi:hypothetical protein